MTPEYDCSMGVSGSAHFSPCTGNLNLDKHIWVSRDFNKLREAIEVGPSEVCSFYIGSKGKRSVVKKLSTD